MRNRLLKIVVSLVLIAGTLGIAWYYYYYSPRLRVEKSTKEIAGLSNKTFKVNNELADKIKHSDIEVIDQYDLLQDSYRDRYVREIDSMINQLDTVKSRHEELLEDVNRLDTPQETKKLKQDIIEINEFYIAKLPEERRLLTYSKQSVIALGRFMDDMANFPALSDDATDEQVYYWISDLKAILERSRKDLASLDVPTGLTDHHKKALSLFDERIAAFDKLLQALNDEDYDTFDKLSEKLSASDNTLDKQFGSLAKDKTLIQQFDAAYKSICDEEFNKVDKAKKDLQSLKDQFGDKWVSDEFRFERKTDLVKKETQI